MPFVRISHTSGKSEATTKALSAAVHQAMVETFNVPADDFFQIVTDHAENVGIVSAPSFLGIEHTKDIAIVQITCAEGRSTDQKKALYIAIADKIAACSSVKRSDVIINLVETKRENWSFGNGIAPFAQ